MKVRRTVVVDRPIERVFDYLSDFAHLTEWDPGTEEAVRSSGDGGVGTTYRVLSRFAGRRIPLVYTVTGWQQGQRFRAEASTASMQAVDVMTFAPVGTGTVVSYDATFTSSGGLRCVAWLLGPAFKRLGDQAEAGMRCALEAL